MIEQQVIIKAASGNFVNWNNVTAVRVVLAESKQFEVEAGLAGGGREVLAVLPTEKQAQLVRQYILRQIALQTQAYEVRVQEIVDNVCSKEA